MPHSSSTRSLQERLWLLVQVMALAAIVVSPLVSHESKSVGGRTSRSTESALLSITAGVQKPGLLSITSRVVPLPVPSSMAGRSEVMDLEVETRQLRFERAASSGGVASERGVVRRVAAVKDSQWELVAIRRRVAQESSWESIDLIRNDFQRTLGSAFVELNEGLNEFSVVYRSDHGETVSYPVRVRHIRKHTT